MSHYSDATKRFLLATKHAEIDSLRQLAGNCKLVTQVTSMIHHLQRERGISNVYLVSGGSRFKEQKARQQQVSIDAEALLTSQLRAQYLSANQHGANSRLLGCITVGLQGLDSLSHLRKQAAALQLSALASTQAYSRLINGLLAVVFEAADVASDPAITRLLVALFNFSQSKEFAGQERAWGAIGFAKSQFDHALCERLEQLQADQAHSIDIFLTFCDSDIARLWHDAEAHQTTSQVQRLRGMIKQLADGTSIDNQLSEIWYDLTTARIDAMLQVEEALTDKLLTLAEQQVTNAQNDLTNHERLLSSLDKQKPATGSPFSILFDPTVPGLRGSEAYSAETQVNPAEAITAHRSFYDLLCNQSARINKMTEELEQARQAITDHKTIDRAKLLLMQQWGLSESQAYRRLQQSAMESNTRIASVARKVVDSVANRAG